MTGGYPPATGDDPPSSVPSSDPVSAPTPDMSSSPEPGWAPPGPSAPDSTPPGWPTPPPPADQPPTLATPYTGDTPPSGSAPAYSALPTPADTPYGQPPVYFYPDPLQQPPSPPRKSRVGLLIGIVAAVVVVVLGGTAAVVLTIGRERFQPALAAAPSASSPTHNPAVSPEEYQRALDVVDQELGPLYTAMVGSKHPDDLQTTAFALAKGIENESVALSAVEPPTAIAAAHQHLVEALRAFGSAVSSVGSTNL